MSKVQAFLRSRSRAGLVTMLLASGIAILVLGAAIGETLSGFAAAV